MGKAKRAHHVGVPQKIDGHGLSAFAHPTSTPLSFRPAGEIFKGAGIIRTSQDSSLCSE
jgi:hypothetical protein